MLAALLRTRPHWTRNPLTSLGETAIESHVDRENKGNLGSARVGHPIGNHTYSHISQHLDHLSVLFTRIWFHDVSTLFSTSSFLSNVSWPKELLAPFTMNIWPGFIPFQVLSANAWTTSLVTAYRPAQADTTCISDCKMIWN